MGYVSDLEEIRAQNDCDHDIDAHAGETTQGSACVVEECPKCGLRRAR